MGTPLAVVTGASRGIGLELARQLVGSGFDLVVAADEGIEDAAAELRSGGAGREVEAVQVDLATPEGVDELVDRIGGRAVDALLVNAGMAVGGGAFIDTDLERHLRLISLNVRGAVHLVHRVASAMATRKEGRILITSSIAAKAPGPYLSTYSASKAFLHSFAEALRVELSEHGVTVTSLMPGPTDTAIWAEADMEDTAIAQMAFGDPAKVAAAGIDAMMAGDDHVIPGLANKASVASANVLPDAAVTTAQSAVTKPGSGG